MQTAKESCQTQYPLELGGLKSLSLCPKEKDQADKSPPSRLDSSWTMYSPSSSSSLIGHCIGMESCVDYWNDEEIRTAMAAADSQRDQWLAAAKKNDNNRRRVEKRAFPPPIPWLARTGNLPSHMPWVFKKYYTDDGRLVIREEKVRHHEYFRAHRSNGRLTLHLVPLNDDGLDHQVPDDDDCIEDDANSDVEDDDKVSNDDDDDVDNRTVGVEESTVVEASMENGKIGKGGRGGGGKCIEYKSMRSSTSCIFGMQVPPFRPVHI